MIGELISWVKNGKAAGPSGVVSKMIKIAAEAAVDMITDQRIKLQLKELFHRIGTCNIVNCYKGKENALERDYYQGLKTSRSVFEDSSESYGEVDETINGQ